MCWKLRVYSRILILRGGEGWRIFCNLNLLFSGATRGGVYFDAQLVSASSPDKNSLQCLDVLCIKGSFCSPTCFFRPGGGALSKLTKKHNVKFFNNAKKNVGNSYFFFYNLAKHCQKNCKLSASP